MTRTLPFIVAALLLAAACAKDSGKAAEHEGAEPTAGAQQGAAAAPDQSAELERARRLADHPVGEVELEALAALIDDGACAVFDANTDRTRAKFGLIPTATALSHYREFAESELPASRATKLVFYCSNESCGASHTAAEKAVLAGFDDVNVFPAGIMGWRDAGKPTQTYQN